MTILALSILARPVFAQPPHDGPFAVLALISGDDSKTLARLSCALQSELDASAEIEVLSADKTVRLLSGGGDQASRAENLERLRGIFQQGYLQSYSFEYEKAIRTLNKVIEGLKRIPAGPERWELWIKAKIFQGISHAGLKNMKATMRSFASVLRTRPDMKLSLREYSPKTIRMFEKARKRLASLDRGRLAVESEPTGATVLLDGQAVGETPFIGGFSQGRYHLQVQHPDTGSAVRWIEIGRKPVRLRFQLSFEGALEFHSGQPCVRIPAGSDRLPDHWWPWLGDRLGLRHLIVVRSYVREERPYLAAALVDLERGRKLREGWLESTGEDPEDFERYAADLTEFLITGKAAPRLEVKKLATQTAVPAPTGTRVPDLPIHYAPRPWYRKWWPYATAGGVLLGLGIGAHLTSDYYSRKAGDSATVAGRDSAKEKSDAWLGVAIGGYVLAAGTALTWLVMHLTYEPVEIFPGQSIVPVAGPDGAGIVITGRF